MKIIEADQGKPYRSFKKGILKRKINNEYLNIILKNSEKNLKDIDVVNMLKDLNEKGCTCAMLANVLGSYIVNSGMSESEIIRIFGFSLINEEKNTIDFNKLMLDIYSKLYQKIKMKTIKYDKYKFKTPNEAVKKMFGEDIKDTNEAIIFLFKKGIILDGKEGDFNIFKNTNPKIDSHVDTYKNFLILEEKSKENNTVVEYKDLEIYEKLSGLTSSNFNFWSTYYFDTLDLPIKLKKNNAISIGKEELLEYMHNPKDYFIEVSVGLKKDVFMHELNKKNWNRISSNEKGHAMLFKGLDENDDILVASYGKEYVIPIEFASEMEFSKIKVIPKEEMELEQLKNNYK